LKKIIGATLKTITGDEPRDEQIEAASEAVSEAISESQSTSQASNEVHNHNTTVLNFGAPDSDSYMPAVQSDFRYEDCEIHLTWADAKRDIHKHIQVSRKLHIMTSRGGFISNFDEENENEGSNMFLQSIQSQDNDILVLLPDIEHACPKRNWILQREGERPEARLAEGIKSAIEAIKEIRVVKFSQGEKKTKTVDATSHVKFYDSLHIGKIIILDNYAYFQPYFADTSKNPVFKYNKESNMYKCLDRLVACTSEFARPINATHPCQECPNFAREDVDTMVTPYE